jgi:hypothetical protein
MQCIKLSHHFRRYDYSAEREYLRNQPQTQEVTKLRVDLLYALAMRDIPYFASHEKQLKFEETKFNPSQPRVPAGQTGGGQWVGDNVGRGNRQLDDNITTGTIRPIKDPSPRNSLLHDAQYAPSLPISGLPGAAGAAVSAAIGIARAIDLYKELSRLHEKYPSITEDERPIIEFYARQYSPILGERAFDLAYTRTLNKEETQQFCPRLGEV